MQQADEVTRIVREVLGTEVVGVYLHGSAVLGGLRPHSDTDVFAVVRRPTTHAQRRALVERLLDVSGRRARRGPARPVELTVVVRPEVVPWRYPPRCEFQYGEWLRDAYEAGETPGPTSSPDLALLITMVCSGDTPLYGPPPGDVLPPVPAEDVDRAIVAGVPDLLDELVGDTRNVLLTLARVWTTLAEGVVRSKDGAADWALARLPGRHHRVLAHARAVYLGDEEEDWTDLLPEVRACADHVVAEIRRLYGPPHTLTP